MVVVTSGFSLLRCAALSNLGALLWRSRHSTPSARGLAASITLPGDTARAARKLLQSELSQREECWSILLVQTS